MRVLALDTTTRAGSAAVVVDDRVVVERSGDPTRTHAERLPRELLALVDAAGLSLPDIDLFAVAAGPGSFTGLRIGIATIQGLALVERRRVVAVSALEALAAIGGTAAPEGALVAAWMDAHRREVFSALYRVTDQAAFDPRRLVEVEPPTSDSPEETAGRWTTAGRRPALFVGDGAVLYADVIRGAGLAAHLVEAPPLSGAIGRLALARAASGEAVDPAAVRPLYVRRPDAEIARDAKR